MSIMCRGNSGRKVPILWGISYKKRRETEKNRVLLLLF